VKLVKPFLNSILLALLCAPFAATAGVSLGEAQVQSALGQPLRVRIPLTGLDSQEGATEGNCYKLLVPRNGDDLPMMLQARSTVSLGKNPALLIQSSRKVDDPIIQLSVQVVCGPNFQRDYTLLLDPAGETVAAVEPPAVVTPPVLTKTTTEPAPNAVKVEATPIPVAEAPKRKTPRAEAALDAPAPPRRALERSVKPNQLKLSQQLPLSLPETVALASPKLKLSLGGDSLLAPTKSDSPLAQAVFQAKRQKLFAAPLEVDLDNTTEAELIVTQKRLQELQSRLNAAGAVASPAASPAASATPQPPIAVEAPVIKAPAQAEAPLAKTDSKWTDIALNWLWFPLLIMSSLLVAWMLWRHFNHPKISDNLQADFDRDDMPEPIANPAADAATNTRFGASNIAVIDTKRMGPGTIMRIAGEHSGLNIGDTDNQNPDTKLGLSTMKGPSRSEFELSGDLFHPKTSIDNMGVVEISAVTEEASVYIELGRKQEAIDILRDHVDLEQAYDKATPAPWLMLLDLYHSTQNRAEFDSIKTEFTQRFNGSIPEWEDYDSMAAQKPLLDYPHIIESLQRYWGTNKCRTFIERLLYDNREGNRLGFSLAAYRDLVILVSVHDNLMNVPVQNTGKPTMNPSLSMVDLNAPLSYAEDHSAEITLSGEVPSSIRRLPKRP
jgi:pilus assembly protein FimV